MVFDGSFQSADDLERTPHPKMINVSGGVITEVSELQTFGSSPEPGNSKRHEPIMIGSNREFKQQKKNALYDWVIGWNEQKSGFQPI